jgi:hypothetical protein
MMRARVLAFIAVFVLAMTAHASAQESAIAPTPPKAQSGPCVAPPDVMRRTHMTMLKHQRDDTVHQGVRGKPEGLTNCITCHAVKDKDGGFVTAKSPQHFCRTCHDYAAVQVDCFECHGSRPETGANTKPEGHK